MTEKTVIQLSLLLAVVAIPTLAPRRCRRLRRIGISLHHRAARRRDPVDVLCEAGRDAVAVRDGITAHRECVIHASILLVLALGQCGCGNECDQHAGERKCPDSPRKRTALAEKEPVRNRDAAEECDRAGKVGDEIRRVWQLSLRRWLVMRCAHKARFAGKHKCENVCRS